MKLIKDVPFSYRNEQGMFNIFEGVADMLYHKHYTIKHYNGSNVLMDTTITSNKELALKIFNTLIRESQNEPS